MRLVRPLLTAKVYGGIAGIVRWRVGLALFAL
jgi:hypothetical protein